MGKDKKLCADVRMRDLHILHFLNNVASPRSAPKERALASPFPLLWRGKGEAIFLNNQTQGLKSKSLQINKERLLSIFNTLPSSTL
jgi:hypothetical protein